MLSGRLGVIFFFSFHDATKNQSSVPDHPSASLVHYLTRWLGSLVQVSSTPCIHALMLRGETQITSDHVPLLRLVCTEWIFVLFCDLPFCWGSVHSLCCAQPWLQIKIAPSSGVHVNQRGWRGWGYNEIMKCVSAFFFSQDRPLGCNIFRHNKAIAGGVQSLWLSYRVFSTCQCATACLRA